MNYIDDKTKKSDNITAYDAMMFPVIGSAALLTLYFAYKFLDPFYVNLLLTLYLTLAGVFSLQGVFTTILEPVFPNFFKKDEYVKTFKLPNFIYKEPIVFNTNKGEIVCLILSFAIGLRWIFYKDFITHNVLAVSFFLTIILSKFVVIPLMAQMFLYTFITIYIGSHDSLKQLESFEAPVKLLFPVSSDPVHYSMLGLGDIIIPGILMSLCLRFDYYLFKNNIHKGNLKKMFNDISIHESFKKYYFYTIIIFYELGLVVTYCMLFYFEHPQPALLYLVPACILAILACSICKREFKLMIKYQEITDKSNTVDDASKNKKKDKEEIPKIQETPVSNAKKRITNK
ncbi:hypothetical protein PFUGPA_04105 [Plasmodium falciparum Palo Alto/Uganda]|uniref:Signal peptide peptidase n=1 Tax=Plasmodium falciparum (isolate Palo Alto / Uganda) TaxID=57270 RepID=W4IW56_PLAFP|nr:hypothetical protein PFUGPA_04105 [Plasmodium falciparum Palo Alto/Uganda]